MSCPSYFECSHAQRVRRAYALGGGREVFFARGQAGFNAETQRNAEKRREEPLSDSVNCNSPSCSQAATNFPSPCKSECCIPFGGTGGIASRAAPDATPRPPSGHLVANRWAPRSHPEATLRLPSGYPEAPGRVWQSPCASSLLARSQGVSRPESGSKLRALQALRVAA